MSQPAGPHPALAPPALPPPCRFFGEDEEYKGEDYVYSAAAAAEEGEGEGEEEEWDSDEELGSSDEEALEVRRGRAAPPRQAVGDSRY